MTITTTLDTGKLLLKPEEAAARLSIGRTTLFELVRTNRLRSVQIGKLRRFRIADLEHFASNLARAEREI